jgi:hypothetical protein
VGPTRLPPPRQRRERYAEQYAKPVAERASVLVVWESDGAAVGFPPPTRSGMASRRTCLAGFRYVKTHRTVPGPLNYHHAVTRRVYEVDGAASTPRTAGTRSRLPVMRWSSSRTGRCRPTEPELEDAFDRLGPVSAGSALPAAP